MIKFCKRCQTETERHKNGGCKSCASAYYTKNIERIKATHAVWRSANTERERAGAKARYASNIVKVKKQIVAWRSANSEKHKAYQAAWHIENSTKTKARQASYRAANPEKVRASISAWKSANIEKLRIYVQNRRARRRESGGILSADLSEKLFKLQRGLCPCCGLALGSDNHLDHILPIKLGGHNDDSNVQLLHSTCNLQKSIKHPIDFMRSKGFLL